MNKYNDKTLDINLEASRKMATMGNLAIKAAKEKENSIQQVPQKNISLFAQGALDRVTRLADQMAIDESKTNVEMGEERDI